jgi:hypothetical protein
MRNGKLRSEPISGEPIWLAVKMPARHFCYVCLSQTYWLAVDRESGDADL